MPTAGDPSAQRRSFTPQKITPNAYNLPEWVDNYPLRFSTLLLEPSRYRKLCERLQSTETSLDALLKAQPGTISIFAPVEPKIFAEHLKALLSSTEVMDMAGKDALWLELIAAWQRCGALERAQILCLAAFLLALA